MAGSPRGSGDFRDSTKQLVADDAPDAGVKGIRQPSFRMTVQIDTVFPQTTNNTFIQSVPQAFDLCSVSVFREGLLGKLTGLPQSYHVRYVLGAGPPAFLLPRSVDERIDLNTS